MSFISAFQTTFGDTKKESEIIGAIIGGRLPTTEIGDFFLSIYIYMYNPLPKKEEKYDHFFSLSNISFGRVNETFTHPKHLLL